MKKYIFILLSVLSSYIANAQTQVKGKITEEGSGTPLSNVMVLFYNETNNKIETYTQSNEQGEYTLGKRFAEGIYKLEASKLGYHKDAKRIVIGTEADKVVTFDFVLRSKVYEVEGVTFEKRAPIVVKKDTIIYDIPHFTDTHDESLEEVLAKIQGFKILPNGEIEVNGKKIRKVLVDGKEVSDFGAAMITRSLSPEKVEKVEVRFDEKNEKLKESLLDAENFVVLDITLKKNVKRSLFGKQRFSAGYQQRTKIGGLTNLFSLNSKANIQFFAENNNFNKNEIDLYAIRNIGEEAFARIFTTPVDMEDIKTRQTYQEETFGFEDFITNDNAIVGLSMNFPLSNTTDLYIGSFNNYHFLEKEYAQQSFFDGQQVYAQEQQHYSNEYNSKNKIQLKHTSEGLKVNADLNYVYFDQALQGDVRDTYQNLFKKKHYTSNFYFNQRMEYKLSEAWGVFSDLSFSKEDFTIHSQLFTNHPLALSFFGIADDFRQENRNVQRLLQSRTGLVYQSGLFGTHTFGYKYHGNSLENEKLSQVAAFAAQHRKYHSENRSLFYKNVLYVGGFDLQLQGEYTSACFPYGDGSGYGEKTKSYFQYNAHVGYNFSSRSSLWADVSHQLDYYPLQKATFGDVLQDYQTIYKTQQGIQPFYNTSYALHFSNSFYNGGELYVAYLRGISNNVNSQSFNDYFIFTNANQLSSHYDLFSFQYEGKISDWKLSYRAEPEFLFNSSEYLYRGEVAHTTAYRLFAGLKFTYTPHEQVRLYYYPKYSYFIFDNSISQGQGKFDFLTNKLELTTYFFDKKLLAEAGFQQVNFFQTPTSFNNLTLRLVYKTKKYRWYVEGDNLLGSKYFMTQDFNQSLLNVANNRVFGRYLNVGFEFKIN